MASMTRRLRRLMNRTSKVVPVFTEKELSKLSPETKSELGSAIAEVDPDHPLAVKTHEEPLAETVPEPEPVVEVESEVEPASLACPVYDGESKGTVWTSKNEEPGSFGPFKNQSEAKEAIKLHLGVNRMPPGTFSRK